MSVKITRIPSRTGRRRAKISRMQRSRPVILQGMEPGLADRGPGRIIFLNRASSSATSTLATAMQQVPGEPFLHVSPDHLVASGMLPGRRDPDGPFACWDLWGVRSAPSL